jgi:hypothetical protein
MAAPGERPEDAAAVRLPGAFVRTAFLTALSLAVLLLGAWAAAAPAPEPAHVAQPQITTAVAGDHDGHEAPIATTVRQHVAARIRNVTIALLAVALVVAGVGYRRVRRPSSRTPRPLWIAGRPPGRAPPSLRIA